MSERKILFINLVKGVSKESNKPYFRIDYVNCSNYRFKSDFISAIDYDKISKKIGDKHFVECTAILSINEYDNVIVSDIKI